MTVTPEATYTGSWLWITLEITSRLVYYQATVSHSAEMLGQKCSLQLCNMEISLLLLITTINTTTIFFLLIKDRKLPAVDNNKRLRPMIAPKRFQWEDLIKVYTTRTLLTGYLTPGSNIISVQDYRFKFQLHESWVSYMVQTRLTCTLG